MDLQFPGSSDNTTVRRGQKRRRKSPEMPLQLQESESNPSGAAQNMQNRGRTSEEESAPQAKRGRMLRRRETGQISEERMLRSNVSTRRDAVLSTSVEGNSSNVNVNLGVQQQSIGTGRCSRRKRNLPSHEGNRSLDLQTSSPARINRFRASSSRGSEIPVSPDYVRIVQQMEEDEHYARSLQAQFDQEPDREAEDVRRILRSSTSGGPPLTSDQPSTSNNSGPETSQERPSVSRRRLRDVNRSRRRMRRAVHARSNRMSSLQYLMDADTGVEEIGLPLLLTGLLSVISTDLDFNVRGLEQSIEGFNNLWREAVNNDAGLNTCGLSTAEISRLPTRSYCEASANNHGEVYQTTECQICLCAYEDGVTLRTLPCFHEFHISCIDKWLKINQSCPVCRALVDATLGNR